MGHNTATYRHHITGVHPLPLTPKRKQTEWTLTQLIAQNNKFPQKLIQNLNLQLQHQKNQQESNQPGGGGGEKMDNFHILQPKNKENHKPIHAHKYRDILEYHYSTTTHKTKTDL
jgi:hypothetical protein